jgi:hypothetical protein
MATRIDTRRRPQNAGAGFLLVFFAAAVLYIATCAPGVVWQDSGVIQYRVWKNQIDSQLGLALAHPLFYIIAIAANSIPIGDPAYKVNLTNAIISALAVANLFLLVYLFSANAYASVVAAMSLALSHTFWYHATIPEIYNLTAALLLCELIALLKYARTSRIKYLYWLAFLNGLAVANHMLASIPLVCYLVLVLIQLTQRKVRPRHLAPIAILWIIGASPYLFLVSKMLIQTGDFYATFRSALFGASWQGAVLNTAISGKIVKENLFWIALNYPTPNALLFFVGLVSLSGLTPRRWFARIILALVALFFLFAFRYTVVDRYVFFLPFYCMVSVLIGIGLHALTMRRRRPVLLRLALAMCLLPIPAYIVAPMIAERMQIAASTRKIPYRNEYTYFLRPWRTGYRGAEKFANEALDIVEPNALIIADGTTAPPLLYVQQVNDRRTDVKIISSIGSSPGAPELTEGAIAAELTRRPVYVVSPSAGYCPEFLLKQYDFAAAGLLYRLKQKITH